MPSVVLAPFIGVYDLLSVGYCSRPVEALSDIAQQKFPLFDGDTELQDPSVASFVEFALYKNEGLGATCKPSSFHLVRR